jgi:biotin synthase
MGVAEGDPGALGLAQAGLFAGANSIFTGDTLLTTPNAGDNADAALFAKLGLVAMTSNEPAREAAE